MSEQKLSKKLTEFAKIEESNLDKRDRLLSIAFGVAALEAKLKAMKQLIEECRKAISQVPDKFVFGVGGDGMTHWYLADELLANITAAQQEKEDE